MHLTTAGSSSNGSSFILPIAQPTAPSSDSAKSEKSSFSDVMNQEENSNTKQRPTSTTNSSTQNGKTLTSTNSNTDQSESKDDSDSDKSDDDADKATTSGITSVVQAAAQAAGAAATTVADATITTTPKPTKTSGSHGSDAKTSKQPATVSSLDLAAAFHAAAAQAQPVQPAQPVTPAPVAATSATPVISAVLVQSALQASTAAQADPAPTPVAAKGKSAASTTTSAINAAVTQSEKSTSQSVTPVTATASKEKKSDSDSKERSFIQSDAATSSSSTAPGMIGTPAQAPIDSSANQQVATTHGSRDSSNAAISGAAGTANVDKSTQMNTISHISEMAALSGAGTGGASSQVAPGVNIKLSDNSQFTDALKQVMHIASLSDSATSTNPMRVAIEIQTPPGAVVNVYVSRQGTDGYRAQLSTNDPQALAWVQDKMTSLRDSNDDLGVKVNWLPPQIESGTTQATTAGNTQFGWDRNNQNQQQPQQQDDNSKNSRRQQERELEYASVGADDFMNTFSSIGSTT